MRYLLSILFLTIISSKAIAVVDTSAMVLRNKTGKIYGTVKMGAPLRHSGNPIVLIVPGSGPTDRDGNNQGLINDGYLALADSLAGHGISTLRYDKRGIGASKDAAPSEKNLRFDMYVQDVEGFIRLIKKDKRFNKVFVLGHGEGSLIGMLAMQRISANGFISVAGASTPADDIMMKQLRDMGNVPPELLDSCTELFSKLRKGEEIKSAPKILDPIFRASIRSYMASWMKYDPSAEIKKVHVPTMIIQGTTDIQVDTASGYQLAASKPNAELVMIGGMNYVLREASFNRQQNFATYAQSALPLRKELIDTITRFVKTH